MSFKSLQPLLVLDKNSAREWTWSDGIKVVECVHDMTKKKALLTSLEVFLVLNCDFKLRFLDKSWLLKV